ncbi:hypothetical protein BgiMline_024053, partial [Biomphalaria glabrata]
AFTKKTLTNRALTNEIRPTGLDLVVFDQQRYVQGDIDKQGFDQEDFDQQGLDKGDLANRAVTKEI